MDPVKVTASDGTASISDEFDIVVSAATLTSRTLVSNTGQTGNSDNRFAGAEHAQAFTTGATSSTVTIISEDEQGDDIALKICEVNASTHPTTTRTDFTVPDNFTAGPLVFTAPVGTTLTGGRTSYMVVMSPGGVHVKLDATASDGFDGSTLTGFSIRNRSHIKISSVWQDYDRKRTIRIAVLGTINP